MIELNKIYKEDCRETLTKLPDKSINCCVTSPPYYGLRDYGDEGQIGLEETPEQYVEKLVFIFREVRRVLRDDGTLWLNLGDSYNGSGQDSGKKLGSKSQSIGRIVGEANPTKATRIKGLKPKDLIGIPWMVAFALRADGWYLRQDIIWHKPNPMPESVTDRCTKAHEYIFLLSKSQRYYYDAEAIKEKSVDPIGSLNRYKYEFSGRDGLIMPDGKEQQIAPKGKRDFSLLCNKRSVWTVNTKPYKEAHFATYPEKLIVPCIKAGCPEDGTVYDPFMGAGTTALVAHKLNRKFIGSELNPEYVKITERRIEPYLMQQKLF